MKKILSMIMSAAMLFSVTAFAADAEAAVEVEKPEAVTESVKVKSDNAYYDSYKELSQKELEPFVAKLKQLVKIPEGEYNANGTKNKNPSNGEYEYYINLSVENFSVSATICNDMLLNFYQYSYYGQTNETERKYPQIKKEDALKTAKDFINKAYAKIDSRIKILVTDNSSYYSYADGYYFDLAVEVDGIPTTTYGSIQVNFSTGEVNSLYTNYINYINTANYPKADKLIDIDTAKKKMLAAVKYQLTYMQDYTKFDYENPVYDMKIYYQPEGNSILLDAITGEFIDTDKMLSEYYEQSAESYETPDGDNAEALLEKLDLMMAAGEISQEEYDKLLSAYSSYTGGYSMARPEFIQTEAPEGAKSMKELEKISRAIKGTTLTSSYELTYGSYYDDGHNKTSIASLIFNDKKTKKEISFTLNAISGELISMYENVQYIPRPSESISEADKAKAIAVAEAFAKAQHPEFMKTAKLQDGDYLNKVSYNSGYSVMFSQELNDIPIMSNQIMVSLDKNNKVISYNYFEIKDAKYEDPTGIITPDKIIDVIAEKFPVKLSYVDFGSRYGIYSSNGKSNIRLCYLFTSQYNNGSLPMIVAKTGEEYNYNMPATTAYTYSDIENSPYKDSIEKMAKIGVGYTGTEFMPNKAVTQADLIPFVLATMANYYYYTPSYYSENEWETIQKFAIEAGIFKQSELSENKEVTRAEAVRILFDAHGYNKVLKHNKLYNKTFTDTVPDKYIGYAALAVELGMIKLQDGKFLPDKAITRGELAEMIYKFMTK